MVENFKLNLFHQTNCGVGNVITVTEIKLLFKFVKCKKNDEVMIETNSQV